MRADKPEGVSGKLYDGKCKIKYVNLFVEIHLSLTMLYRRWVLLSDI